jgi:hypothetical protein
LLRPECSWNRPIQTGWWFAEILLFLLACFFCIQDAIDVATAALAKYGIEKDVAAHIKKVSRARVFPVCLLAALTLACSLLRDCFLPSGLRQEVPPHMALHRWPQFRVVRDARNQALHLLLPWPSCGAAVQERLGVVLWLELFVFIILKKQSKIEKCCCADQFASSLRPRNF